ncbi:hypothetical protein TNIN_34701 [Trichonephila inaurata madagascariensis]|uniref:Uncharacterized protein n=1 Tax=Trichonephila inaurata madagascariensis TaxID=2747483 RepID=A0A8X7CLE4_9ARAC|nr:hypothetical protein TNIN_34701 [Trichonephila inaurata madagascariensis]
MEDRSGFQIFNCLSVVVSILAISSPDLTLTFIPRWLLAKILREPTCPFHSTHHAPCEIVFVEIPSIDCGTTFPAVKQAKHFLR